MLKLSDLLNELSLSRLLAKNTVLSYEADLKNLQAHIKKPFEEIRDSDLREYVAHLSSQKFTGKTVARKISAFRQFYAFLFDEKMITVNPALELTLPKVAKTIPTVFSEADLTKLIDTCYLDTSPQGVRNVSMLELLYASGMRVSELLSLKLSDLLINKTSDQMKPFILIKGKGGKERVVPINSHAIDSLKSYLKIIHEFTNDKTNKWLFPSKHSGEGRITRQYFGKILKQLAIKAGLNAAKMSPHKIRHSFATHMLNGGANLRIIQELLGHQNIGTTQIYTHVASEKLKKVIKDFHPLYKE